MQFSTFTQDMKNKLIGNFIEDVSSNTSNYYVCFGQPFPWNSNDLPPNTDVSVHSSYYNVQENILTGKKVQATDIAHLAPNYPWSSNTVYTYYSDMDANLYNEQFYVVNSSGRLYKCLFNNYNAPSTIEPTSSSTVGDFTTADGYVWKYLFTITSAMSKKFTTDTYIPVTTDVNVSRYAENGAIHTIFVNDGGNGSGYYSTNGFVTSTIGTNIVQISNTNSSPQSGIYNLSSLYITSGTGVGYLTPIVNYVVNSIGKFVQTQNPIPALDVTSSYMISPQVQITGDGINAGAVAYVNTYTSGIQSIQIVNRGINYTTAQASIIANSSFVTTQAYATAIIPPPGGHGSKPSSELGCSVAGLSVNILKTDPIPNFITYRQLSLINNPIATANSQLFTNATFSQMTKFTVSGLAQNVFPELEVVTGFVSGATATVVNQPDSEHVYVVGISGDFMVGELITGTYTGYTCYINSINTNDLVVNTGEVLYYKNFAPITRDATTSENIKLYFKA